MYPSLQFLRDSYDRFNRQIFGGRLPEVTVTLCEATSFVGQYKSKIRLLPDGRREHYDHALRFSTAFDLPERELEDTVIHEMIHFFIAYNGLADRSVHGPVFKALMNSINEAHGRAITISRRATAAEMSAARQLRKRWHIIAILTFPNGEKGVKVLPRVIPKVIDYHRTVSRAPNVRGVELFLHDDPFFNQYPVSSGQRCHAIAEADIEAHLRGAHRLEVRNGKLVQC